jgi:hypothetical protein
MTRLISLADANAQAKKLAHTYGMAPDAADDSRMRALSFSLRHTESSLLAVSGNVAEIATPAKPFAAYLKEFRDFLPWNGLQEIESRPFSTCAEAHLWLELRARAKDPLHYYEASFTRRGNLSAPCRNCEQWVFKAFGQVFTPSAHYAGHPKQRPG